MPTPEIPDEVFVAAVREAVSVINRDSHEYNLLILEGGINLDLFRAALGVAYAAGRESAYEGGETEWRSGTSGLTFVTEPEEIARQRARTWSRNGGFVEMRHVGPWVRVEAGDN